MTQLRFLPCWRLYERLSVTLSQSHEKFCELVFTRSRERGTLLYILEGCPCIACSRLWLRWPGRVILSGKFAASWSQRSHLYKVHAMAHATSSSMDKRIDAEMSRWRNFLFSKRKEVYTQCACARKYKERQICLTARFKTPDCQCRPCINPSHFRSSTWNGKTKTGNHWGSLSSG